ncbi:DNA-directed RNA polymerase III subunit RPC8-like isoform X2 [Salvia splendens]|uniref:DNA-directed RNA polymerase III subunit RPC8-like isoform X2 n=1 Tax=Salvia splendens TaxID=180675 RepID=UPI001C25E15A|nr:DNA-directed RNA polymerase III subunit RPC8-like isoform X2 [Salvia splendens]
MFFLSEIEHTLMLPPHLLNRPLDEAIKEQLDLIFLDKVKFRLVMFRPFVGEIITARLKESTVDGLRLSLGFFDDIYVPVPFLFSPNRNEPVPGHRNRVNWIWNYMDEDYSVDAEDEIMFKVHDVSYPPIPLEPKDVKPFAPMVVTGSLDMDGLGPTSWWG